MFETVDNASKALSSWPLWNAIFLVGVVAVGFYLRILAARERGSGVIGMDMPMYLMLHDTVKNIEAIRETLTQNGKLLEDIRTQLESRPPRTR